jgi:hypothetical protein
VEKFSNLTQYCQIFDKHFKIENNFGLFQENLSKFFKIKGVQKILIFEKHLSKFY